MTKSLQERAINTLRFLSADAIQQANSGHPGLPMGAAAMAYTIWTRHLRHYPKNPKWLNRDRFVLSGGHGSALLYSLLHLTGYDISLDDLKNFRQWGSLTPGHPEYGHTPGVEVTTGPLGMGFANGVGFAIAESHLAARFNQMGQKLIDHYIYAIVTDGDLMEGIASEAASLAGTLKLGKLIYLYDDNHISIDGSTDLAFTEDRAARFKSYGWHVQRVEDGNNVEVIDAAIKMAKADSRPSIIMCRTIIGYGSPNKEGTHGVHGSPLGDEELAAAKDNLGADPAERFAIGSDVLEHYREAISRGRELEADWKMRLEAYIRISPTKGKELQRRMAGKLPENWADSLPVFEADSKGMATRAASGKVLNAIAENLPELIGGSADLAPSNKTWLDGYEAFSAETLAGRNFHFGVREHAMGAIVNGMAVYGGIIPYGGTFLVFSDFMRGALRVAALSKYPSIWVFTHDSIGVGEDGPTHQPIEHFAALRAIPDMTLIRPADANETAQAWKSAIENRNGTTALILTRQNLPTLAQETHAEKGAYILKDFGENPDVILMASGSEVSLILAAAEKLAEENVIARVVSVPSLEIFEKEEQAYRESVFPPQIVKRFAVEMGIAQGWWKYVGSQGGVLSIEKYGASAPAEKIFEEYGFTVENVVARVREILK
ncbi:MAG: transketolase [Chloroflexi bacterium]|nr:transketolase [Chloroflexota bacterium]